MLGPLLKSKLNARNLINAVNIWEVAVVRYSGGLIDCTKKELEELDRKTKHLLVEKCFLQPKANTIRLHTSRKTGGCNLKCIEEYSLT